MISAEESNKKDIKDINKILRCLKSLPQLEFMINLLTTCDPLSLQCVQDILSKKHAKRFQSLIQCKESLEPVEDQYFIPRTVVSSQIYLNGMLYLDYKTPSWFFDALCR